MTIRFRHPGVILVGVVAIGLLPACRSELRQTDGGAPDGVTGGSHGSGPGGSVAGSGGVSASGGTPAVGSGGAAATGGTGAGGSTSGIGGAGAGPGGATSIGGTSGSGGVVATGGLIGSGGRVAAGGTQGGSGGVVGAGGGGGSGLGNPGDPCTTGAQCSNGVCADGVCCNGTCGGQCEACNTSAAKGMCVAVTTPRTACTGSGTCGGRCDGTNRASCVYPATTVSCGAAASCTNGKASTAALCDGAGTCKASTVMTCTYGCRSDGLTCDTGCPVGQALCGGSCVDVLSSPTHCGDACTACGGTTTKCTSGACVQCLTGNDCSTGQVCTTSHTCQCRPKSATNLILNPGFDASIGGGLGNWTPSTTYAATFSTDDADGCAGSGSAHVAFVVMGQNKDFGQISQCVPVVQNTSYYLGYKLKQDADGTTVCELWFYTGASCAGSALNSDSVQLPSNLSGAVTSWTQASTTVTTPSGAGSVQIICHVNPGSSAGSFDQIYLNSAANNY